jgi:hypothetical protein
MHTVMEGGRVGNLLWSIKFWLFYDLFLQFFWFPFCFPMIFSLRSLSFRFWFPAFRFEAKQAKKRIFFASKRSKFCLFFASFRFNRKRTAHPTLDLEFPVKFSNTFRGLIEDWKWKPDSYRNLTFLHPYCRTVKLPQVQSVNVSCDTTSFKIPISLLWFHLRQI